MKVHVLSVERRYVSIVTGDVMQHLGHKIISISDTVPTALPRLGVWMKANHESKHRYYQLKYKLSSASLEEGVSSSSSITG